MKYLFLFILLFSFYFVSAQRSYRTGSVSFDADLVVINNNAQGNMRSFISDMTLSYNVSEKKLNYMSVNLHMVPAEIYLSLEISRIARVPLDHVFTVYKTHKSQGWGVIAKQLGIKPGSAAFHQLKNNTNVRKGKSKPIKHKNKGKK